MNDAEFDKGEIVVETPHGHYVVRPSANRDGGFIAWTLDYGKLVCHWEPPTTLCEVKADLNAGINQL